MKEFCCRCLTNNLDGGICSNCGYKFNPKMSESLEDIIFESTTSRMATSDEQEKAISRLERKLAKLDLSLDGAKITGSNSLSAVVQAGGQMYHITVGPTGLVQVDGTKVDPKKEDVLIGIFKSHQKLAEQPKDKQPEIGGYDPDLDDDSKSAFDKRKPEIGGYDPELDVEEPKKESYPAIQPQKAKGARLFTKKDLKESVDVAPEVTMTKDDLTAEIMPNGTYTVYEKLYDDKRQAVESGGAPRYVAAVVKDLQKRGFKVASTNQNIRTGFENESIVKEEVVTDIGLVGDSYPEIVDQAMKSGLDKDVAEKFANFMGDRFGKSYYDPSYTQEWIDRFKKGSAWDNADSMTKAAMQKAGLHESVWPEFPEANTGMTVEQAKEILGDRAAWELKVMVKALSKLPMLNTDEENKRLEAAKAMLKYLRSKGVKEGFAGDEAPKANANPDAQLITDQGEENDDEEFGRWSSANKAEKKYGRDFGVYIKDLINKRYYELVKNKRLDPLHTDFDDFEYEVRKALEEL